MTQTNADVNAALSKALENAAEDLSQQRDFAIAIGSLQKKMLNDLESSNNDAQTFISRLINAMDSAIQAVLTKITSAAEDLESDITRLHKASSNPNNSLSSKSLILFF